MDILCACTVHILGIWEHVSPQILSFWSPALSPVPNLDTAKDLETLWSIVSPPHMSLSPPDLHLILSSPAPKCQIKGHQVQLIFSQRSCESNNLLWGLIANKIPKSCLPSILHRTAIKIERKFLLILLWSLMWLAGPPSAQSLSVIESEIPLKYGMDEIYQAMSLSLSLSACIVVVDEKVINILLRL